MSEHIVPGINLAPREKRAFDKFLDRIITYPEAKTITMDYLIDDAFYYYPFVVERSDLPIYWKGHWNQSGATSFRRNKLFEVSLQKFNPRGKYRDGKYQKVDVDVSYHLWLYQIKDLRTGLNFSATWCEKGKTV